MDKPSYTSLESVKMRLSGKVQFEQARERLRDGQLPSDLLAQIIVDAETEVEQDLRRRYAIPFQSRRTGSFEDLPDHTKRAIRQVVDYKAVINILITEFGMSSNTEATNYLSELRDYYDELITKLMGRDKEASLSSINRFRDTPPLEDLKLAASNRFDNGFAGTVRNTTSNRKDYHQSAERYAAEQQNNPAMHWVEGWFFDDHDWRE